MNPWRERLQRWLDPLARRCPFSPNSISVAAAVLNVTAGAVLATGRTHPSAFLWMWLPVAVAGILDGLDGAVARAQGKTSRFGDFLDHLLDRLSDLSLLAGWCLGAAVHPVVAFSTLIAVMLNGYVGTQIEASFGERSYDGAGRGEFVLIMICLPLLMYSAVAAGWDGIQWWSLTPASWATLLLCAGAVAGIVGRVRRARKLAEQSG